MIRGRFLGGLIGAILLATGGAAQPAAAKFASLVVDARTGAVLEQFNADAPDHPASLTKMMTLYLTFQALESGKLRKNQVLRTSAHASIQSPSKLDLAYGETITVEQAILALTVKSANDAAVVLGEALGGTETHFGQIMTQKARQLGMLSTVFRNASGLPNPAQITTARDMATLARALLRDYPQYYHYFSAREFAFRGAVIPTHNHVLTEYDGADGFKTGYIHASGFNIVSSAQRDGHRLIAVVLGGLSVAQRDQTVMSLLDSGFAAANVRVASKPAATSQLAAMQPAPAAVEPVPNAMPAAKPAVTEATPVANVPVTAATAPAAPAAPLAVATRAMPIPPPEEPAMADEVHETNWGIQVGAYNRLALAQTMAHKALLTTPELKKAAISIGRVKVATGTVYRARLVGLSEEQARSACVDLHKHKNECLLVTPGSDRSVAQIVP